MSDDEEGGGGDGGGGGEDAGLDEEEPWARYGSTNHHAEAEYGYFDNGELEADAHQIQQALAFQAKRQQQRRKKRTTESQLEADAQSKHSKAEADQLFPYREDHPQDPRIMGVDYQVVNGVTYYCSVNLWLLLYREAQTGQPVM